MFKNLNAEQRRFDMSNSDVAKRLGISRVTYEKKKKNGGFSYKQIVILMRLFGCKFEYLFSTDTQPPRNDTAM